ncbi:hypothetical protein QQF64_032402 [Cirrhinus molitorella]|uniref:Uncharacterized protein n=1 Tax=Cirrhinus molitorella TaxID=172907 RepID=A0ABR3MZQ4_9TELE
MSSTASPSATYTEVRESRESTTKRETERKIERDQQIGAERLAEVFLFTSSVCFVCVNVAIDRDTHHTDCYSGRDGLPPDSSVQLASYRKRAQQYTSVCEQEKSLKERASERDASVHTEQVDQSKGQEGLMLTVSAQLSETHASVWLRRAASAAAERDTADSAVVTVFNRHLIEFCAFISDVCNYAQFIDVIQGCTG